MAHGLNFLLVGERAGGSGINVTENAGHRDEAGYTEECQPDKP
jgi:hypothetical protein